MSDWQPIATAPKDGTEILAWFTWWGGGCAVANWTADSYSKNPRPFWTVWGRKVMDCRQNQPTHWMPLPKGPEHV